MTPKPDVSPDYNPRSYPPVAVAVDVALFTIVSDELFVLLVERGQDPWKGAWALPGGFVRPDEDLEASAVRELAEETGVHEEPGHLEQLGTYGSPDRDPRMRVVSVAYWAIEADLPVPVGGGDAAFAALVPMSKVEHGGIALAFDHKQIVRDAVERARSKLEYTTLAAKFCPPEFTISQLRRVYESVWNVELDQGNFHRQVTSRPGFLQQLEHSTKPGIDGGRPASLWSAAEAEMLESPIYRKPSDQVRPARQVLGWAVDLVAEGRRFSKAAEILRQTADGLARPPVSSTFWGCSDFPTCRGTRGIHPVGNSRSAGTPDCPKCGGPMVKRTARDQAALVAEGMPASPDDGLEAMSLGDANKPKKIQCADCQEWFPVAEFSYRPGAGNQKFKIGSKCHRCRHRLSRELYRQTQPHPGYYGAQTAKIVGITYRQLDYWNRTDLISPSMGRGGQSRTARRYSYLDLLKLQTIKALLDAGIRLQVIREVFDYVEEKLEGDLTGINLVIQGTSVIVQRGNREIDHLLEPSLKKVRVLPLTEVKADLDAKITKLDPGEARGPGAPTPKEAREAALRHSEMKDHATGA